eukprot:Nitzschia sp. Nitz4//scaffold261_size27179//10732//12024//NITZ4_008209-RA/size27179-processed-gene-0.2-mRNA-1//1//CDS//3329544717//2676//frame0
MDVQQAPLSGRGETHAYPKKHSDLFSRIQFHLRKDFKAILATLVFVVFLLIVSSDVLHDSNLGPGGSLRASGITSLYGSSALSFAGVIHHGYFVPQDSQIKEGTFRFAAVTDLDQLSRKKDDKKPTFRSVLLPGTLVYDSANHKYTISFEPTRELTTKHNEAGRGAEFSELAIFNQHLLTFDDRTGEVFEILNTPDGQDSFVAPRYVITEGDGDTDKGMKWEWATVKDGELWMGSMGKEFTKKDGSIDNTNNLWVTILNPQGSLRRVDWEPQFSFVRQALGAQSPGYLIHEAIRWSAHMQKWVFMPRRISNQPYDDVLDEKRGSNKVVLVNEKFTTSEIVSVNMASKDGLHGFSSFAFVPGTNDKHALALRSVEEDCAGDDLDVCKQRSYLVVFDVLSGEVLMDEVLIEEPLKYEGVEFVDMYTVPPAKK